MRAEVYDQLERYIASVPSRMAGFGFMCFVFGLAMGLLVGSLGSLVAMVASSL